MTVRAVLFDFDGTLVETRNASWTLFAETDRQFGLGIDTQQKFFDIFEGNFFSTLATHCGDEALANAAAAHFMELIRTRYNPAFIPGMDSVLRELSASLRLTVLSSNKLETIQRILSGAGLETLFDLILASDIEPSKAVAIENFLAAGDARDARDGARVPYAAHDVVLVTDTVGDVAEGVASGIKVIGVTWGMHSRERLRAAGAAQVAESPAQLLPWISHTHGASADQLEDCRA